MAQQIKLKRSAVAGKVPSTGSLAAGELAINTVDGKLYFKRDDDTIQSIVTTNAEITGSVNINGPITGSNIKTGNILADGNLFLSGSNRLVYNDSVSSSLLFGFFDGGNIYGPYYQIFGNSYSNLTQRGSAEFVYDNRNGGGSGFNIASFDGNTWTRKFRVEDTGVQVTGSLGVTGGITGSLFGTSSYALSALSSSYALTASYAENIVISGSITSLDAIDFETSISYTPAEGRLGWDNGEGTLQLGLEGGNVTYSVGEQMYQYVYNAEATSLTKGEVVLISGSQGNRISVKRANNSGDPSSAGTLGFVAETITAGTTGWVITEGPLRKLNTVGLTPGALLFLGAAPGTYTETPPTAPSHSVRLGYVERVHASVGSIYVKIDNGYEIGESHDVVDTTTTASYGDLLVKQGKVWQSSRNLTGSYTLTGSLTALGEFVGSLNGNAATATTASYALTASAVNQLNQNVVINGNLQVFGSSSFTYVTSSQLKVDDAFISVNVFEPVERFGGLIVYDSGSSQATASLAWDSLHNHWVYQNASGSMYTGGMLLSGPRNTGSLGDEPNLAKWYVPRSDGGDHLDNSQIFSSGSTTIVTGSLTTTGKVTVNTVDNYGSDPDKFLAIVNGEIVYRTGAQVLSDIGGQTAGTFVQNAGGGGQARYILRYEDSNSATTSSIYEDTSGRIGINRTTPAYPLDISGSNLQIGSVVVGRGLTPNTALVVGSGSLTVFTGSSSLTVYGNNTLTNLTTGFANDAFGAYALNLTSTGSYNSAFGQSAGRRNNGSQNVFFGQFSGPFYHTLTGGFNTFIGPLSGIFSSGSAAKNTGIGASALYNLSDGIENTAIGSAALFDVTTGSGNIAFGFNTGRGITTGNGNLVIGNGITGLSSNLSNNIIIGDGQGNIKYRYADHNTTVSGSLSIQGSTTVVQQGIFVTGLTSLTVASISTGSYEAAFLDYMLSNGSNKRAGTLTVVWTASDIEWNDASTLDLGSTAGAEFTPTLAGSNANIVLAVPGGDWTVKGHLRYM